MIDSIDNSMAAPSGEADFSGAVSPEAEALTEAAAQAVPLPSLLGEDGGFVPVLVDLVAVRAVMCGRYDEHAPPMYEM